MDYDPWTMSHKKAFIQYVVVDRYFIKAKWKVASIPFLGLFWGKYEVLLRAFLYRGLLLFKVEEGAFLHHGSAFHVSPKTLLLPLLLASSYSSPFTPTALFLPGGPKAAEMELVIYWLLCTQQSAVCPSLLCLNSLLPTAETALQSPLASLWPRI